jgi:hypothetical protein
MKNDEIVIKKIWLERLVRYIYNLNTDDESENICEIIGYIKAGECFLQDTNPKE